MDYKILNYDIKNAGRMCDALGIIFGIGIMRRLYIMDLFGFGRTMKAYNVNYYMKDCLRIFISHYTYNLGSRLQNMIKQNLLFYVNL
jgi:ribosomal protein S13